jgi:hypothetical protein
MLTHEDLRKRAVRWLAGTEHCGVVLSEITCACSERPDAVGWHANCSYSVECKASRSDFLANRNKIHVRTGRGVGQFRYFMTPKGLIRPGDLDDVGPDGVGVSDYGLLWCSEDSKVVTIIKKPERREACLEDEITMLVSALRRVRAREFLLLVREKESGGD